MPELGNGFEVDEELAYDNMAHALSANLNNGAMTFYAVVCINADTVSSHGGLIVATATEAIEGAKFTNENAIKETGCVYIPLVIGLSESAQAAIAAQRDNQTGSGDDYV